MPCNAIRTGIVDIGNLPGAYYTSLMPEADALKMVEVPLRELRPGPAWDLLDGLHRDKVNAFFLGRQKSRMPFHLYINKKINKMDLNRAYETARAAIIKANPETGPRLKELLGE